MMLTSVSRENPFPGVNPWMQSVWSDVHTTLIGYIRDELGGKLPDDLTARAEENIALCSPPDSDQARKTDVAVVEAEESWKRGERPVWTPENDPELAGRVAEPVLVETDEVSPRWVEVRTARGELVTVIEVTSPANKTLSGRKEFEKKVRELLQAGVNVMEIDLIRGGRAARDERGGKWPTEPYQIIVNRPQKSGLAEVYPCRLRDPLPVVPVPLRAHESDTFLDLQPLIDRCYTLGRYWMLPYAEDPKPTLDEADLTWARKLLEAAGLGEA